MLLNWTLMHLVFYVDRIPKWSPLKDIVFRNNGKCKKKSSYYITDCESMSSPQVFWWGPCCSPFQFFVLSYYVSLRSEFRVAMSVTISAYKERYVRLYLQLFVGRLMSYLRFLCSFAYSGVQHIFCCVFVLFFFVLCMLPDSI